MAKLFEIEFNPDFLMQDACQASFNAAKTHFKDVTILMCYFHVLQNAKKKWTGLNAKLQDKIKFDIHFLHMTRDSKSFKSLFEKFLKKYEKVAGKFCEYFKTQWTETCFRRWKVFNSPPGYAATNSPIEGFNNKIKKIYTKRKRLSVYAFVMKMVEIIRNESLNRKPFLLNPIPSKECKEKAAKIKNKYNFRRISSGLFEYIGEEVVYQYDEKEESCSCAYYLKWMFCIHTIAFQRLFKEDKNSDTKNGDKFVNKPKKGRIKKATKCLSKD
jgi:hypothetical protein